MNIFQQFTKGRTFPAAFPARVLRSQQAQHLRSFPPLLAQASERYHHDESADHATKKQTAAAVTQAKATSFALWNVVSEVKKDMKELLDATYGTKTKEDMIACMEETVDGVVDRVVDKAGVRILTLALARILDGQMTSAG